MKKREWKDPELIVIVRCRLEERVLFVCKENRFACGDESGPTAEIAPS